MIVWINGTFGVGKTTAARELLKKTNWRVFDPEHVGYLLAGNLRDLEFDDFQDLPPWRTLVPAVADEIYRYTSPTAMIAVQSVLVESYWAELVAGLSERRLPVLHVVLECDESEFRRRMESDEAESGALGWRLGHISKFRAARQWLVRSADVVLDTTNLSPESAAEEIIEVTTKTRPQLI